VIERAEVVRGRLENGEEASAHAPLADDLPLFAAPRPSGKPFASGPSAVDTALGEIRPDELSPRQALEALYRLKDLSKAR
jgi:DNA mismatch repair protein MutS